MGQSQSDMNNRSAMGTPPTATLSDTMTQTPAPQPASETFESFIKDLERPPNSPTPSTATQFQTSSSTSQDTATPDNAKLLDISPSALYPRTMSCRQAFDQAFYCQSLGGKFNDIYRYGSLQSCSENWNQFWFCMRNRTFGGEHDGPADSAFTAGPGSAGAKGERVAEYYAEREKRNKATWGSSEDVWDIRTEPVERAFWRDPDEVRKP